LSGVNVVDAVSVVRTRTPWVRWISWALPPTWGMEAMRKTLALT